MDHRRFDGLVRCAGTARTRRGLLRALLGGVVATAFGSEAAAACAKVTRPCSSRKRCCSGLRCKGGKCRCNGSLRPCTGRCVNQQNDRAHCGACERRCQSDEVCCRSNCIHPTHFQNDNSNCGRCRRVCPRGAHCVNGACTQDGGGLFGRNLVVNGDAETGPASPNGHGPINVPGWTVGGQFTVVRYGTGGWPKLSDPGPEDRGQQFFSGGRAAVSEATQTIDVSTESLLIDAGRVDFELAGFLGGYSSQSDNASLTAFFLNAAGVQLGASAPIGPVTAAERSNRTGLLERSTDGGVPSGTRLIELELTLTRRSGSFNDGYADNISLVLSTN